MEDEDDFVDVMPTTMMLSKGWLNGCLVGLSVSIVTVVTVVTVLAMGTDALLVAWLCG